MNDGTEAIDLTDGLADEIAPAADGMQDLEQKLLDVDTELLELEETLQQLHSRQQLLQQLKEELQRRIKAEQRAPKADWATAKFSWDLQMQQALHTIFGLTDFRPLQREVMNATLQGRDVLLLLPSGGGKSLCYQLPAAISGGVTLVVSPLLSLIMDQVMSLPRPLKAFALTSLSTKGEAAQVMAALTAASKPAAAAAAAQAQVAASGLLLYVTPEKIVASKRLMSKLEGIYQAGRLSGIAIDEAHCCSTWGNDFRPDYKKLGILKQQFPNTPIIALTATAPLQVCQDITAILKIQGAEHFSASINRPNLAYEVLRKPATPEAAAKDIVNWIREHYPDGQSGIVYCLTRKDCETLASQLQDAGIAAAHYHADMEPAVRTAAHQAWSSGALQVMVATIAFGMGINKPDVRWVLHACLSKSVENYYQESGRAGRDGQPARCVLFYRLADVLRQASVVCMDPTWQRHLMMMTGYAAAVSGCRRAALAAHFCEAPPACNGQGMCDLCKAAAAAAATAAAGGSAAGLSQQQQQQRQRQQVDATAAALSVVSAIKARVPAKRATLNQLLDDMHKQSKKTGSSKAGSSKAGSSRAGSSRAGNELPGSRDEQEWVVEQMLLRGLLHIDFGFTAYSTNSYLVVTQSGEAFAAANGSRRFMAEQPQWAMATQQQQQQRREQQQQQPPPREPAIIGNKRKNSSLQKVHAPDHSGKSDDESNKAAAAASDDDDSSFGAEDAVAHDVSDSDDNGDDDLMLVTSRAKRRCPAPSGNHQTVAPID